MLHSRNCKNSSICFEMVRERTLSDTRTKRFHVEKKIETRDHLSFGNVTFRKREMKQKCMKNINFQNRKPRLMHTHCFACLTSHRDHTHDAQRFSCHSRAKRCKNRTFNGPCVCVHVFLFIRLFQRCVALELRL